MSVNKVILIGRLGQNPELKYTQGGTAVANFSLATNEVYTDKSGQRQESTEWHRIVVWGKQAELCSQYLAKGREVFLEGKIQTRQWQDQNGQTRYTTEVVAQNVRFLGGQQQQGASAPAPSAGMGMGAAAPSATPSFGSSPFGGGVSSDEPSFTEDDIPF